MEGQQLLSAKSFVAIILTVFSIGYYRLYQDVGIFTFTFTLCTGIC